MFSVVFTVAAFCLIANVSSFRLPAKTFVKSSKEFSMSVFDNAVEDWAAQYPAAYSIGWGPTTKAERWNGR
jgi:hypothetical protein